MNPPGMAALPPTGKTFLVYLIKTDVQGIYELGWGKVLHCMYIRVAKVVAIHNDLLKQ